MTIIESARALLVDPQDRVLLMKLAFNAHQTVWLTPGGSLHPGESFEDALRREIREETGLTLGPSPGGRGKLKPFSPRENGWDEGERCNAVT